VIPLSSLHCKRVGVVKYLDTCSGKLDDVPDVAALGSDDSTDGSVGNVDVSRLLLRQILIYYSEKETFKFLHLLCSNNLNLRNFNKVLQREETKISSADQ
jgi:hypothetical protein